MLAVMSKLADALFNRTQKNVLALLYGQPAKSFYTNEILRLTGMGVATVKRELDRMVDSSILSFKKTGNQNHYQANPYCAIYIELVSIVRKTSGIGDVLESTLQPLLDKIDAAFVYGPHAAGVANAEQAIDLLIISSHLSKSQLMPLLNHAADTLARIIHLSVVNQPLVRLVDTDNETSAGNDHQLLPQHIMQQPKIWIKGMENDLRKAG